MALEVKRSHLAGIDPGLKGGVAILDPDGKPIHTEEIPIIQHTKKSKLVNAHAVADVLRKYSVDTVAIENVATRPGQGIASSGTFMKAVGTLYGVAAGCGCVVVWTTPTRWKRYFDLIGRDKEASRAKAIELFPELAKNLKFKKDADKAEAALIGYHAYMTSVKSVRRLLSVEDPLAKATLNIDTTS